jgi:phage terminase large subunit-like protein
MGKVWLPKNAPWKADLLNQLMRFPAGKFDDGVDVLSLFGRGLVHIGGANTPVYDINATDTQNHWMAR